MPQVLEDKLLETKGELRKVMRQTETFLNELNEYRNASANQANSEAKEFKAHLQTTKTELKRLSNYINQSKSYVFETRRCFEAHMQESVNKVMEFVSANRHDDTDQNNNSINNKNNDNNNNNTEVDNPTPETMSLPFDQIEEQLVNALNDLGNPFAGQKLLLDNIRNSQIEQSSFQDDKNTGHSDEGNRTHDDATKDMKTSLESMETVVFCGDKQTTTTTTTTGDSESRRGSQSADGLRHISHIIEKRKFEDLKDAIIAKNRYVNTIIQQMIEDVDLLKEKLPKPTLFGRKKANARREIISRLHTHLNAAVKSQVEV